MNYHKRWLSLLPQQRLDAGQVVSVDTDGVIVQLPTNDLIRARGTASIGDEVFVRGGVIEGPAPALSGIDQQV